MVTDAKTHHEAAGQTRVEHDLFSVAVEQFTIAADVIGLNDDMRQILSHCQRELTVHFPVEMDDGSVEVFTGYRVQHNSGPGPTKGGKKAAIGRLIGETIKATGGRANPDKVRTLLLEALDS